MLREIKEGYLNLACKVIHSQLVLIFILSVWINIIFYFYFYLLRFQGSDPYCFLLLLFYTLRYFITGSLQKINGFSMFGMVQIPHQMYYIQCELI